jgi:hypothetical protein
MPMTSSGWSITPLNHRCEVLRFDWQACVPGILGQMA